MRTPKDSPGRAVGAEFQASRFRVPHLPVEWLDGASWRLPSGKALAEFALRTGFLAPAFMRSTMFGKAPAAFGKAPAAQPRRSPARAAAPREIR
ncbi:MAG: hypothetical protein HY822_02215 [Acidobacteria bacterium]|nr:hypothetical protein [Acidobacteriota bacterium]